MRRLQFLHSLLPRLTRRCAFWPPPVPSFHCWLRMGDDWRMDIGARKTDLITDGLFGLIRHPIYAFSMLLMVCSAVIVPTAAMIAIAVTHLTLMNLKARNEEDHLSAVHGETYRRYVARTGRFFPRLRAREP